MVNLVDRNHEGYFGRSTWAASIIPMRRTGSIDRLGCRAIMSFPPLLCLAMQGL
jgi:hypothetical protein